MNRGHELLLRGDAASLGAALTAYDAAIAIFHRLLPALSLSNGLAQNPGWANSLGAALMNRGQLLHRLYGVTHAAPALAAFDEAAAVLRDLPAGDNPWPRRNLTGTLVNRANLLLDLAQLSAAAAAASDALVLTAPHERADPVEADLALKARRSLGDALGHLLVAPGADQEALARQASDVVDDALALIRHWSAQPGVSFRPLALRFFRYGVQLYRLHQPHFLAEFITENLPPADAEFTTVALAAIDAALGDGPGVNQFLTIGDPVSERLRETWRDLAALRARLTV